MTPADSIEALAFVREQRQAVLAADPVHYFVLTTPDGKTNGDIHEMHQSQADRLNEERRWFQSHREQERERARDDARREFKRTYGYFGSENPPVIYGNEDCLWKRTTYCSGPVVTMEGTTKCSHD